MHAIFVQILPNLAQFARQLLTQFSCKFCAIFPFFPCNYLGKLIGNRAFVIVAASVWNKLPQDIISPHRYLFLYAG